MRRREFLSEVAGVATVAALGTTAAAATTKDWRSENVGAKDITHEFDEAFLKKHRPLFVADIDVIQKYKGLYGYKATSPEYDYNFAYYWSQLTHQDGLPLVRKDTHLGDHEPIICAVDPETDELDHVIWANYHHFAGRESAAELQMVTDETSEQTHPVLEIDPQWHNYYSTGREQWSRGDYPLEDWLSVRDSWLDNGVYSKTADAAVEDPELMENGRDSWWADGEPDAAFARLWRFVGIGGAGQAKNLNNSPDE